MTTQINVVRYASPIGKLSLASIGCKLVHLDFEDNDDRLHIIQNRRFKDLEWQEGGQAPAAVIKWLDDYFTGTVWLCQQMRSIWSAPRFRNRFGMP